MLKTFARGKAPKGAPSSAARPQAAKTPKTVASAAAASPKENTPLQASADPAKPLAGIVAYVDITTANADGGEHARQTLGRLGATVLLEFDAKRCTHLVFKEGNPAHYYEALAEAIFILPQSWVSMCDDDDERVDERSFARKVKAPAGATPKPSPAAPAVAPRPQSAAAPPAPPAAEEEAEEEEEGEEEERSEEAEEDAAAGETEEEEDVNGDEEEEAAAAGGFEVVSSSGDDDVEMSDEAGCTGEPPREFVATEEMGATEEAAETLAGINAAVGGAEESGDGAPFEMAPSLNNKREMLAYLARHGEAQPKTQTLKALRQRVEEVRRRREKVAASPAKAARSAAVKHGANGGQTGTNCRNEGPRMRSAIV